MCRSARIALAILGALLPLATVEAHQPARSEWRTKEMNVDIPARPGAVERREFRCELEGPVYLSWDPAFRDRAVEIRVVHSRTGRVLLARKLSNGATLSFQADADLLCAGKNFDILVRPLRSEPQTILGKLHAQRLMKKD